MSGELAGHGACPANPAREPVPTMACTKDNVTNLVWSLDSPSYNWADATTTYPTAMNVTSRCGFNTGWRLPTGANCFPSCIAAFTARPSTAPISPQCRVVATTTGAPMPMRPVRPPLGWSISTMAVPPPAPRPRPVPFVSYMADCNSHLDCYLALPIFRSAGDRKRSAKTACAQMPPYLETILTKRSNMIRKSCLNPIPCWLVHAPSRPARASCSTTNTDAPSLTR